MTEKKRHKNTNEQQISSQKNLKSKTSSLNSFYFSDFVHNIFSTVIYELFILNLCQNS